MLISGVDKSEPTTESPARIMNGFRFSSPPCLRPIEIIIYDGTAEQSLTFIIVLAVISFNQLFMSYTRTRVYYNVSVFKCECKLYIYDL
jgi:hypothetical protein